MRDVIKAKEVPEHYPVSYWKTLELVRKGKIPHFKVGNRILFRRSTLEKWFDEMEKASVE